MQDDLIRRRLVVHGRVQGVFFRDSVRERAASQDVAGWVRNRPDGTVEAVLEGSAESVQSVVRFCEQGPSRASVDRVEVSEEPPEGLSEFAIR